MSLSGIFYGVTTNPRLTPQISWSAVQNVEGNYSDVTAKLQYTRSNSGYTTGGTWEGSLTIDGVETTKRLYMEITYGNVTTVITTTVRVYHDSLGEKTITISGSGGIVKPAEASLKTTTISETVTLDTIARASSITSAASVTLGNACSVKWTPNSDTFGYKLMFSIGDWEHITEAIHPNKTSAHTYSGYTLPLEIAEQIPEDSQGTMSVVLYTYSDSECENSIGSYSETFTVTVPDNAETQPSVTMKLTAVDSPFEGLYLQGLSRVQAKFSAEAKLGARIEGYRVNVEGCDYEEEPYLSNTLQKAVTTDIVGYAQDSRDIRGSVKQTITVLPYYNPKLIDVEAYRCKSDGTPADNGEYLKIKATRDYAPVIADGKQHNFCKIQFQYKAENDDKYSEPVTILEAENLVSNTVVTDALLNATFSKEIAYSVKIIAVDTVGRTVPVTKSIPSEYVFRHKPAGGRGLGLGGYCEGDNLLDVHWNQRVRKDLTVDENLTVEKGELTVRGKHLLDLIYPVGSIYMSVSACDPALLFGGTWEQLKDRFLLAAGDVYEGGSEAGEAEHILTVDEMPEHDHAEQLRVYGYSDWPSYTTTGYGVMFDIKNSGDVHYHQAYKEETVQSEVVSGDANTNVAGSGNAHNNMPPYLAVYIYKRTA